MRKCRDFNLNYTLLEDGRVVFHFPDTDTFAPMTDDDYFQFEAAYPNEIELYRPAQQDEAGDDLEDFINEDDDEEEAVICSHEVEEDLEHFINGVDGESGKSDDTFSDASSDFVSNPDEQQDDTAYDDDLIAPSPYKRPSNPEPQDDTAYDDDLIAPSPYKQPSNPEPNTPRDEHTPADEHTFADEPTSADEPITSQPSTIPTSPYRRRATEQSWTSLEYTEWGYHTYLTMDGRMAVRRDWEIESGALHGVLQHCTWYGSADRDDVVLPWGKGAPELKVTTPEGEEYWLDDGFEPFYEFDCFVDARSQYGHTCDERCTAFYEEWPQEEEPKEEPKEEQPRMTLEGLVKEFDDIGEGSKGTEVSRHSGYSSRKVKQCAAQLLATISEEGDFEEEGECLVVIDHKEEKQSGLSQAQREWLVHVENPVYEKCNWLVKLQKAINEEYALRKMIQEGNDVVEDTVEQEAVEDIQGEVTPSVEENEEAQEAATPAVEEKRVPRWIREPLYVSRRSWADLDDEEDEEY
ncbi:hypothetical protein C8A05DRAFT_35655 [Staphylotrichum tortipilum]|uniref:Uncharacterized protein n=1 Tax=Staphylotrichum tortipilum TaxID=2831512 RepID=A0AAN6RRF9_9PEZI|nr:hypothetical protein C8A05DRAFT_35655 [Staphylotrichum longicolle]